MDKDTLSAHNVNTTEIVVNQETKRITYEGHEYLDIPRIRELIKRADAIKASLPQLPDDFVRLWRGNRPNEVGNNPSFTNSLVGIALPFMDSYQGDLSYVEIPRTDLEKYVNKSGSTPNSEFTLPADLAATAKVVEDTLRPEPIKQQITEYSHQADSSGNGGWEKVS